MNIYTYQIFVLFVEYTIVQLAVSHIKLQEMCNNFNYM